MTPRRLLAPGLAAAVLATTVSVLASAPVHAEQAYRADRAVAARPLPRDDSYGVYASGDYSLPVLDNDETSLLSSGDLTLCGVTVDDAAAQVVYAEIDPAAASRIRIETDRLATGVVRFTYDACQGDRRSTATVTLTITRLEAPRVTTTKRRARIAVRNPNAVPITFQWGSNTSEETDGLQGVPAGERVTIRVDRRRLYWLAVVRDQGTFVVAGDGTLTGIRKHRAPRRRH